MYSAKFDIDLDFGQLYEKRLQYLLQSKGKIEVKTERNLWASTGNIAIEVRYRGKPSGLSTTEADWWFHILTINGEMVSMVAFPVHRLKRIVKKMLRDGSAKKIMGGDENKSEMVLLPVDKLLSESFF